MEPPCVKLEDLDIVKLEPRNMAKYQSLMVFTVFKIFGEFRQLF